MGAPADFKLNTEFTAFLGSLSISAFEYWDARAAGWFIGYAFVGGCRFFSLFGLSALVAACMDSFVLAVLPLLITYTGAALCWKVSLRSLGTLTLLFRGKKYNVLRSRVDHHNYDLEQLLMGVVLLSLFVFLSLSLHVLCLFRNSMACSGCDPFGHVNAGILLQPFSMAATVVDTARSTSVAPRRSAFIVLQWVSWRVIAG